MYYKDPNIPKSSNITKLKYITKIQYTQHESFLTIFSLWTQQIEERLVAIKSAYFSP